MKKLLIIIGCIFVLGSLNAQSYYNNNANHPERREIPSLYGK